MPMLPPGLNQKTWELILAEFRAAVGPDWVLTSDDDTNLYRDAYSPSWGEADERLVSAAVVPTTVEQVQAIVRTANKHRVPIYTISTGKNLGYGGSAPNLSGSVVLDLKRMDKIIEVDDKRHFAIVEPGVTYFDLYRHIQENGLKTWIDVPDPGWGSLVGNALDHGVGHTMAAFRDHFYAHCGMEVVLPNGEIMRTGMGAMPGAQSWADFRYGFGPYVDGLFGQGNFGVVTKMGFHLMPQPEAYLSGKVLVPRRGDIVPLTEIVNELEYGGLIGMPEYTSAASPSRYVPLSDEMKALLRRPDIFAGDTLDRYASDKKSAFWAVNLQFYGPVETVQANWAYAKRRFAAAVPGVTFKDNESLRFPLTKDQEEAVEHKVLVGIPNMNMFSLGARSQMNPEPRDGHLLFAPILPRSGEAVLKGQQVFMDALRGTPLEFIFTPFTAPFTWVNRAFALTAGFPVSRSDPAINRASRDAVARLIKIGADNGYGEYRTPPQFQDAVMGSYSFNNNILRRFNEAIKDAVDPNGILAAGRSGVWPKHLRKGGA